MLMNRRILRLASICALALATAPALVGCAALEIQVDVYKGPLANHKDIQLQQLTSMAMAARVLMLTRRNDLLRQLGGCSACTALATTGHIAHDDLTHAINGAAGAKADAEDIHRIVQLNGLVSFFEDLPEGAGKTAKLDPSYATGREKKGIDWLATELARELADTSKTETTKAETTKAEATEADLRVRLERALIDVAARMHYYALNMYLVRDPPASTADDVGDASNGYQSKVGAEPPRGQDDASRNFKSLLEAVANTILVHADDHRHRIEHEVAQRTRAMGERTAANAAFGRASVAFDEIVSSLRGARDRATVQENRLDHRTRLAQQAHEASAKQAQAEAGKLKSAGEKSEASKLNQQTGLALAAVLGVTTDMCKAIAEGNAELVKECLADTKAFDTLLKSGAAEISVDDLHATLEQALTQRLNNEFPSAAATHRTALRLTQARDALDTLKATQPGATKLKRAEALKALKSRVATLMAIHKLAVQSDGDTLAAARLRMARAEAERDRAAADLAKLPSASNDPMTAARLAGAIELIAAQRTAVVSELGPAGKLGELEVTRGAIAKRLDAESDPAKADQRGAAREALLTVRTAVVRTLVPDTAKTTIDVVDSIISQLRYQHLAVIQRGGENAPDAKNLEAAIAAAFKQRAGMTYLRPSSAYLRSVFAATETQTDPGLGWRNLLNDSMLNTLHKARDVFSDKAAQRRKQGDVRETLDKAFWQNVNTVRLNAGGSSNFVVAKDDVGNWYVKAMGSDPSAMIKTAKQLALYNTGARFNSNLLRVDELRDRIDDKSLDSDERSRAERELNGLTGTQGSAAVTARATTLGLFQNNHNAQTLTQLKDLARKLQPNNEYFVAIVERWKTTFKDSGVDITKELLPLATGADVQKHMAEAQVAAVPPEEQADAGKAITDTLAALSRYRLSLRASVLALTTLNAAETTSVGNADSQATKARDGRDSALKAVEDSTKLLTEATRRADEEKAKSPKDEARIKDTAKLADDAMRSAAEKSLLLSVALASVKTAEDALVQARKLLLAANARRDKAADDVDAVLRKDVNDRASDRLRAIAEFESAIRVIGQSNNPS